MWRWSLGETPRAISSTIFSTYVEVILKRWSLLSALTYFLHVCGGDPVYNIMVRAKLVFSPRMWRWSYIHSCLFQKLPIFSTYVEVIPECMIKIGYLPNFLHVCGGDPIDATPSASQPGFSPRMWRWSQGGFKYEIDYDIFSTYVEVILARSLWRS